MFMRQIEQFLCRGFPGAHAPSPYASSMLTVRQYVDGQVQQVVQPETISELLCAPGSLIWVDIENPTPEDIGLVARELSINHLAVEDLLNTRQRPKLECFEEHFFLVARSCALEGSRLVTRVVDAVFAEGWIVTVRKPSDDGHPPMSIDEVVARFERQRSEHGSTDEGFVVYVLLDTIVDGYFQVDDATTDLLDRIEVHVFEEQHREGPQREIYQLRHALLTFRRAASPLREVVDELLRQEAPSIGPAALLHLRDVRDHLQRVLESIDSQRELLTGTLEAHLATVSNQLNQVMKNVTSWGAILVSATLVAGIYGMNFKHMPELDWKLGYPMSLGMMGVLMLVLYLTFKRRDWL